MSLKTHEPSAGRLRRAERDGDLPVSATATQSVGFALGILLLPVALAAAALRCLDTLQQAILQPAQLTQASTLTGQLLKDLALILVPWLAAVALGTTLIALLQTRGFFRIGLLAPKADRLRPDRAWSGLLEGSRWLTLLLALSSGLLVAGAGAYFILHHLTSFAHAAERPLASAPLALWIVQHVTWVAVALALLAGLTDWLLRRAAWQQRLRMSHAEWLEDQKNTYGDPLLRAERKRLQREHLAD